MYKVTYREASHRCDKISQASKRILANAVIVLRAERDRVRGI
jgi:hypothetical protein